MSQQWVIRLTDEQARDIPRAAATIGVSVERFLQYAGAERARKILNTVDMHLAAAGAPTLEQGDADDS